MRQQMSLQLSVCMRYVRERGTEMLEKFLGFCSVPRADAEIITSPVDSFAKSCGLNMVRLVGKAFDEASTMSGHVSGVSAINV